MRKRRGREVKEKGGEERGDFFYHPLSILLSLSPLSLSFCICLFALYPMKQNSHQEKFACESSERQFTYTA